MQLTQLGWPRPCKRSMSLLVKEAVLDQCSVAIDAEMRKAVKCSSSAANYIFVPIVIEKFGAVGLKASALFSDLGRRLHYATYEPRAYTLLMQCISFAVQRGNAACVIG